MRNYKCDNCGKQYAGTDPEIYLKGVIGIKGGLLLPEKYHGHDFCCKECFWEWIREADPKNAV